MDLTRDEIIEAVNNALVNEMELDPAEIAPEKTFFDDLGLDSIDMVDLIIGLQRKFGISLHEDDEIKKVRTLGDVYDFFEHYQTRHPCQGQGRATAAMLRHDRAVTFPENPPIRKST